MQYNATITNAYVKFTLSSLSLLFLLRYNMSAAAIDRQQQTALAMQATINIIPDVSRDLDSFEEVNILPSSPLLVRWDEGNSVRYPKQLRCEIRWFIFMFGGSYHSWFAGFIIPGFALKWCLYILYKHARKSKIAILLYILLCNQQ